MITHKKLQPMQCYHIILTLEMYTFPKIAMSIIPLEWYRWPEIQGLAHGLHVHYGRIPKIYNSILHYVALVFSVTPLEHCSIPIARVMLMNVSQFVDLWCC